MASMMMVASKLDRPLWPRSTDSAEGNELKVILQYPENERSSVANLENMMILTPTGSTIPVRQIAQLELGEGLASIERKNRKRSINVTADVDLSVTNGNEVATVMTTIMPKILQKYNSIAYSLEGEQKSKETTFVLLGKTFTSYDCCIHATGYSFQIIFSTTSRYVIYSFWYYWCGVRPLGLNLSVLSMMGIVALTGVVVNDSLVMVDFINRYRSENSIKDAVLEAGPRRFRPIFLTSLTTFVGLIPLI